MPVTYVSTAQHTQLTSHKVHCVLTLYNMLEIYNGVYMALQTMQGFSLFGLSDALLHTTVHRCVK